MEPELLKRILKGSAPRKIWIVHGIPAVLVETEAEHIFKGVIIAEQLTRMLDADLGLVVKHFIKTENSDSRSLEYEISRLASLLATAIQAKIYLKRGFNVGSVLERCLSEALRIIEGLPQRKDIIKLINGLLKD